MDGVKTKGRVPSSEIPQAEARPRHILDGRFRLPNEQQAHAVLASLSQNLAGIEADASLLRDIHIEPTDTYVKHPLDPSNTVSILYAEAALRLAQGKHPQSMKASVLLDDLNVTRPRDSFIGPERVRETEQLIRRLTGTDAEVEAYSEIFLWRAYNSLMDLIKGEKKKGACAEFDALCAIGRLGQADEFARRFAEKHSLKLEEVKQALEHLTRLPAEFLFISLPNSWKGKVQDQQGQPVDAEIYYRRQQESMRKALKELGMGELTAQIKTHFFSISEMDQEVARRLNHIVSAETLTHEEVAEAKILFITNGKLTVKEVRDMLTEAPQAESGGRPPYSASLSHHASLLAVYPEVLRQARKKLDVELLGEYLIGLSASFKLIQGERYSNVHELTRLVVLDILSWHNIDIEKKGQIAERREPSPEEELQRLLP